MLNTTIHSQFPVNRDGRAAVNLGDTKPATFCKKIKPTRSLPGLGKTEIEDISTDI